MIMRPLERGGQTVRSRKWMEKVLIDLRKKVTGHLHSKTVK